jgi:SAM-dependent methyltransferase
MVQSMHGFFSSDIQFMNDREGRSRNATSVADEVCAFYEDYPYPPPVDSLEKYKAWRDPQKQRAEHHLLWPSRSFGQDQSILIAGCGTSQAAKHAMRWPAAQITAIDFSPTSVRCTEELKRKYKLDNLKVHQLSIERARELETSFDQIVCTGVLHHLPDPDAGLSALRDVLEPHGAMHVMVYAPYGRTGIYMLQDFCKRIGIGATDVEIRDLIEMLKALPPGHPLQSLLRNAPDFRNEAALADALLHPCDRAYSVPELLDFLARGGLKFIRWARQAAYSPGCGVMGQLPQASRILQLSLEDQYAAAELFRGTMLRHSAIVHRNDAPDGMKRVGFSGDTWLNYVPIRMPDTVCVQEKLPPGKAAVLINQSHTYRDIYMPIDAAEMQLLDSIDGSRSVSDIVDRASPSPQTAPRLDIVRAFFERLWWHDQVVFDLSATSTAVVSGFRS